MADIGTRRRNGSVNSFSDRRSQLSRNTDAGGPVDTATDISFTSPDTISSAGSGFPTFVVGSLIQVTGSESNSREFVVATSSASTITVVPAIVTTESAGATVSVRAS